MIVCILPVMADAIVRHNRIAGTNRVVFQAWEKIEGPFAATHSTITRDPEHGWLGRIGTRRTEIPDPPGPMRTALVERDYLAQHAEAVEAIEKAYPALAGSSQVTEIAYGEIELQEAE